MIMNNVESLESMGLQPAFVFIDVFTGTTVGSRGITSDISNEKRQVSRLYRERIEDNEDLMKSLNQSGQFSGYVDSLHRLCKMWDKLRPSCPLVNHVNHGVQAGLFSAEKAIRFYIDQTTRDFDPIDPELQMLLSSIVDFEVETQGIIEQVPLRHNKTKWEDIKSIDIREVSGLEIKRK